MNLKIRQIALAVALAVALTGCAASAPKPAAPKIGLTAGERKANLDSFDQVWTTIKDKHFDPKLNGADWDAARAEFRPKVEAAKTNAEARAAISGLIGKLGQTHFGIIPADAYEVAEASGSTGSGGAAKPATKEAADSKPHKGEGTGSVGIALRVVDDAALVAQLEPDSPAAAAGVQLGWELLAVDSKWVAPVLLKAGKLHSSTSIPAIVYQDRYAESLLEVDEGDAVRLTFRDGERHIRVFNLTAGKAPGALAKFGNLPGMRVITEKKLLSGNVGYMYVSVWFSPAEVRAFVQKAMDEFAKADGVILDLRGNPGGLGAMSMGIGGFFVPEKDVMLGTMIMRQGTQKFIINPRPTAYTGPMAIIVDELSMSTSEIFAGGMRDIGRAKIFGTKTPGAALPSVVEKLPNGDGFQYAFANYLSASGIALEGNGVTPDQPAPVTRDGLLAGKDVALQAALDWIATKPSPALPKHIAPTTTAAPAAKEHK